MPTLSRCPECGSEFYNLKAHQGRSTCRSAGAHRRLEREGYVNTGNLWVHLVAGQIPKPFVRFIREVTEGAGGNYLPKWVCALIVAGNWTEELIKRVEDDPELQIAFALEYDIQSDERRFRGTRADRLLISEQDWNDICKWGQEDQNKA